MKLGWGGNGEGSTGGEENADIKKPAKAGFFTMLTA
jgi:hypothetical protein